MESIPLYLRQPSPKIFKMSKLMVVLALIMAGNVTMAQVDSVPKKTKTDWSKVAMKNRANDHFLIQIGYDKWAKMPDSIQTKGFSRSFNAYFMFDFPFKTNPHFSIGLGAGISTSNIYFNKTMIDITGKNSNQLTFKNVSDTNYFKKYKLLTTFLEAPVELRFLGDPLNSGKSFKAAIGAKIGTLISAGTKGKNLLNRNGQSVSTFIQKEKAKRFFNGTRFSLTGRVGYGIISLFASYQVNSFIKEGFGPDVRPYSIGITFSGL